jgi:phosphoribosylformylglycinamidine synthase subunit PurL|tara:strand:+ start:545 stop:1567 length:1023 start_codon:yes stop_codon:yes gene_type:complete
MSNIFETLIKLISSPDLSSKKWLYQQYDSYVMNDTIDIKSDAAIIRVRDTKKALALTSDCTPRYVKANPEIGAMQAVVETYRNISAVGAKPLAITNCLNFGNPEKPEIMGQIVRSIKGITKACKALNYPVVSGNVSLYNETDGSAINPTPTIGGVGLLKDLSVRSDINFKNEGDIIYVIGKALGHIDCSLYQRDILKKTSNNVPNIDLEDEKRNSEFVRKIIQKKLINACHDISDGGLLVSLFEMCTNNIGLKLNTRKLQDLLKIQDIEALLFGEDQARYIIAVSKDKFSEFEELAKFEDIFCCKIAQNIKDNIIFNDETIKLKELELANNKLFADRFSN